jgi:hypothetical protein
MGVEAQGAVEGQRTCAGGYAAAAPALATAADSEAEQGGF